MLKLNQANLGYNIWKGDPLALGGDPGLSNQPIFETECETVPETGMPKQGYYDFFHIFHDLRCKSQFKQVVTTSYKEYVEQRDGSHITASMTDNSAEGG